MPFSFDEYYIGYGIKIHYMELYNILKNNDVLDEKLIKELNKKIKEFKKNKQANYDDSEDDSYADDEYDLAESLFCQILERLKKYPIDELPGLDIVNLGHNDPEEDSDFKCAIGFFTTVDTREKLMKFSTIEENLDVNAFKKLFGEKPKYMTIEQKCRCCS